MDKTQARETGLFQRLHLENKEELDQRIYENVIHFMKELHTIGIYVSLDQEVQTKKIIDYCFKHQIDVYVPKCNEHTLVFYKIESFDDLQVGKFSVLEPTTNTSIDLKDLDCMFVPLSSYDANGNRTGYGKGYYDSILDQCKLKVGLAYSIQKVDRIDYESHDVKLDYVICEEGIQNM